MRMKYVLPLIVLSTAVVLTLLDISPLGTLTTSCDGSVIQICGSIFRGLQIMLLAPFFLFIAPLLYLIGIDVSSFSFLIIFVTAILSYLLITYLLGYAIDKNNKAAKKLR